MSKKGYLSIFDGDKFESIIEMDLPIQTHTATLAWGLDMLRKINKFGKIRKFILRIVLGRYAFRELIGLRDSIEEYGYNTKFDYGLEDMDYHKEKVRL